MNNRSRMAVTQTQTYEYKGKSRIIAVGAHNLPQDALHAAAELGDIEQMREIMEKDPLAANRPHSTYHTIPICWALQNQQTAAVKLLSNCDLMAEQFPISHYLPFNFINIRWAERNPRLFADLLMRTTTQLERAYENIQDANIYQLSSMLQNYLFVAEHANNKDQQKSYLLQLEQAFGKLATHTMAIPEKTLFLVAFLINLNDSDVYWFLSAPFQSQIKRLIKIIKTYPGEIEVNLREEYQSAFTAIEDEYLDECELMLYDHANGQGDLEDILAINGYEAAGEETQCAAILLGIVEHIDNDESYETLIYYVESSIEAIKNLPTHLNIDLGNRFEQAGDHWVVKCLTREEQDYKFEDMKKLFVTAAHLQSYVDYARSSNNKIDMLNLLEAVEKDQSEGVSELVQKITEADKFFNLADMNDSTKEFMETLLHRILWINGELTDSLKTLSRKYMMKSFIPERLLLGSGLGLFDNQVDEDDLDKEEKKELGYGKRKEMTYGIEEMEVEESSAKRVRY